MLMKKQTIWLLTMLSLMAVLSVYYLMNPDSSDRKAAQTLADGKGQALMTDANGKIKMVSKSGDQLAEYRLQKAETQKKMADSYVSTITAKASSTKEISEANNKLNALNTLANNEKQLESVIKSKGFDDAVVMTDNQDVNVYVESKKLTPKQADEIMKMTHEYLGDEKLVSVNYTVSKG